MAMLLDFWIARASVKSPWSAWTSLMVLVTPLDAVTSKDRFGLVEPTVVRIKGDGVKKDVVGLYIPELGIVVDIRFRMLQPPELAAAMSFPKSYKFSGNRENKVMQIGNAVPCRTAQALCKALLTKPERKPRKRTLRKAA